MVAWKARYGYYTSTPTNIKDITFTDSGPFTILTTSFPLPSQLEYATPTQSISTSATPQQRFSDVSTFAYSLSSRMGDDYSAIYIRPDRFDSRYPIPSGHYSVVTSGIPSADLACPNLYNFFIENSITSTNYECVIYIPGLKKLIGGSWGSVYDVGEDGSLTNIFNGTLPQKVNSLRSNSSEFWYGGYLMSPGYDGTPESFYQSEYLYFIQFVFSRSSWVYAVNRGTPSAFPNLVNFYKALFKDYTKPDIDVPDNPYEPGGDSGEGGGGGTFDGDSDQIPDSSLPTLSAADTGFTRLYTPTLSQVQDLARYLWTDESIIETLWNVVKRYFEDPMQAFISFSIVPVPVPVAGVEDFKVLFIPTGVMLNTVANQFVDVDCGTFEMKEYYGSALDYSPNTKVSCYLPYIGTVSLNTDDVMGRTLQVKYRVDICSGSCVAKILVDGNVIYQFPGCCSVPIPFTSADFSSYGAAIISAVKTGVALAAAGAGATELGASIIGMNASQQTGESYTKTTVDTVRNPATGRQITAGTQKITKEVTGTKASFSGIAQTGLANTANSVTASKTIVERSGSFSGNSGYLGVRRPYLIIERPRMCMPANYQQLNGFPSMMTIVLSECKGYTRVQQIQLTGVEATNPEQAEILELLKGGVIL